MNYFHIFIPLFFALSISKCIMPYKECPMDRQTDQLRREFENILESIDKKYVGPLNGWAKLARFLTLLSPEKRREIVEIFFQNEKSENRNSDPKNQNPEPKNMDKSEMGEQNIKATENSNPEKKEPNPNPESFNSNPKNDGLGNSKNENSDSNNEGPENSNSRKESTNSKNEGPVNLNSKKENPNQLKNEGCKNPNSKKENQDPKTYQGYLDQLFWSQNSRLKRLRGPNTVISKYGQNAKLLEAMLKPREQLVAQLLYGALNPGPLGRVDLEAVMELILVGNCAEDLKQIVAQYNRMYKAEKGLDTGSYLLLIGQLEKVAKRQQNLAVKKTFGILIGRIQRALIPTKYAQIDPQQLIFGIFTLCGRWTEIPKNISDMNILLRELLMTNFDQNSGFKEDFIRRFGTNCQALINRMRNSKRVEKWHFWPRKWKNSNKMAKENEEFGQIWRMLEMSGLLGPDAQYEYLAKSLKRAKSRKNYRVVRRILGLHLGVDMLKILEKYPENVEMEMSKSPSKFNRNFGIIFREILDATQSECYRRVEAKIRYINPRARKRVRFALVEQNNEIQEKIGQIEHENIHQLQGKGVEIQDNRKHVDIKNTAIMDSDIDHKIQDNTVIDKEAEYKMKNKACIIHENTAMDRESEYKRKGKAIIIHENNAMEREEKYKKKGKAPIIHENTSVDKEYNNIDIKHKRHEKIDRETEYKKNGKKGLIIDENTAMDGKYDQDDRIYDANTAADTQNGASSSHANINNTHIAEEDATINYWALFKKSTAMMLQENGDEYANTNSEWNEVLVFPMEMASKFLEFLVEISKQKILNGKLKTLVGIDQCRGDIGQLGMAELLRIKFKNFDDEKLEKIRKILAEIDVNFFKLIILFGINLANFMEKMKNEQKIAEKWKNLLTSAFHCFPSMDLEERAEHRAIHDAMERVIKNVYFEVEKDEKASLGFVKIYCNI